MAATPPENTRVIGRYLRSRNSAAISLNNSITFWFCASVRLCEARVDCIQM